MVEFTLFDFDGPIECRKVHVNPAAVASVEEMHKRPTQGFNQPVAVITLITGEKHAVYDHGRKVAKQIAAAQNAS